MLRLTPWFSRRNFGAFVHRLAIVVLPLAFAPGFCHSGEPKLTARTYNSGFPQGHDTYNGMGCASDGRIYYVNRSQIEALQSCVRWNRRKKITVIED